MAAGNPNDCTQCFGAGWVLDAKVDKEPTTLELIPCIHPECPFSGRAVAVLCLYGEWDRPVLHPQTGAVMSLSQREKPQVLPPKCSRPYHCPCGCGSHGECFIYGDELPTDALPLVYSRAMNARLSLGGCDAH